MKDGNLGSLWLMGTFLVIASTHQRHYATNASNITCGPGTKFNNYTETCQCDSATCQTSDFDTSKVYIAGIFDMLGFDWGQEIFDFTLRLLNDHNDGWHDDILNDGTEIIGTVADAGCDPGMSLPAYWDLKTNWGQPLHGVIGCRCSGATMAVARVAGLENVPVVSMASSSAQLSDVEDFPSFYRLVGADDARGQVGALVTLLQSFGWDRVSVISTDNQYTKDLAASFGNTWTGDIAHQHTVSIKPDGTVDESSVDQALDGVPVDDPRTNSRIIVLLAHHQHSFAILQQAQQRNFQPDTVFVGTAAWAGRFFGNDTNWMPDTPGYIGVVPYRNRDWEYDEFFRRLKEEQMRMGRDMMEELPDYAAETMVDSILALAKALSLVPRQDRYDGKKVLEELKTVNFQGVSGHVSFSPEGDRADPLYSVVNMAHKGKEWNYVGVVSSQSNSANYTLEDICWAEIGCQHSKAPSDKYPVPPTKLAAWAIAVMTIISVLVVALAVKYWRSHQKKKQLKSSISEMQKKMDAMKNIDSELLDLDKQVEDAKRRQASLILKRADLQEMPLTWSDSDETLVEVTPEDDQYWSVQNKLKETMDDAWISKIWRVQNTSLWTYYSFHKDRLTRIGIDHNERHVWHGTSSLDPSIIYNDQQDGFMMQFSNKGFWGRGIYFADKSSYSNSYSYKPSNQDQSERPGSAQGEREMFLAKLLVGNEIYMNRDESQAKAEECKRLTVPPADQHSGLKYNTVTGNTGGSQVWIVYENGRAYPDYLIRYYRGRRDSSRTPFKKREEAMRKSKKSIFEQALPEFKSIIAVPAPSNKVTWEYFDNGWKPYAKAAQTELEATYQAFIGTNNTGNHIVRVQGSEWTYEVDIRTMNQTNIEHSNRTKRDVRRNVAL
uniref:Poly [ADP-ribose] polymerase n=1 Tax=Helicotheca tamesis TaxID=374047 RepID=A0A7S2I1X7_9STRA